MDIITLTLAKKAAKQMIEETASLGWNKEIVIELPQNPDANTIYLVQRRDATFDEYIWDADSSEWIFLCTIGADSMDKNYTYTVESPLSSLTLTHNMNKKPSITAVDNTGEMVLVDVEYLDNDRIHIIFSPSFQGLITLN